MKNNKKVLAALLLLMSIGNILIFHFSLGDYWSKAVAWTVIVFPVNFALMWLYFENPGQGFLSSVLRAVTSVFGLSFMISYLGFAGALDNIYNYLSGGQYKIHPLASSAILVASVFLFVSTFIIWKNKSKNKST